MVGIVVNVAAGIAYGCPADKLNVDAYLVLPLQICILVSCVLLADAFRRLKFVKKQDETLSKSLVILLCISFGIYGLSVLFFIPFFTGATVSKAYFKFDVVFF